MAKHTLPEGRRAELCDWLTANGIDPHHVPVDADMTIDRGPTGRFLRCEVFDVDADGRTQIDERGEGAALLIINVPLKAEPPAWWKPYEKPTREQLLAAADRVRVLHKRNEHTGDCEYCSVRDYPDYAVPHPCDTVRTFNGQEL